jgi:hypothetical protein
MNHDEFAHLVRQLAGQQQVEFRPLIYGHVSGYDSATHRIKVIIPGMRDDDASPVESPWMPLCSVGVGAGYGLQIAPIGGATINNPTGGEQVIIGVFGHSAGGIICAALGMTWNLAQQAPSGLAGGEAILKHPSGSYIKTHTNGDVSTLAQGNIQNTASLDITLQSQQDVQISAVGTLDLGAGAMAINSTGSLAITSTGPINIISAGAITMAGTNVFFNPLPPLSPGPTGQIYRDGTRHLLVS